MRRTFFAEIILPAVLLSSLLIIQNLPAQIILSGTAADNGGEYLGSGAEPAANVLVTLADQSDPERIFSDYTDRLGEYYISISTTHTNDEIISPHDLQLHQNYPNPFNPATVISWTLPHSQHMEIAIYNILGRKIKTLFDEFAPAGNGSAIWDATDSQGRGLPAGVYIYSLKTETIRKSRKMLLLDGHHAAAPSASVHAPLIRESETPSAGALNKTGLALYTLSVEGDDIADQIIENVEISESRTLDITVNRIMTDIDGNVYRTVKIGDHWWTAENLKVSRYRNGDMIENVANDSEWKDIVSGAYCAYDNNEENAAIYGYLYNWHAVDDARNIAPPGWRVPTDEDWKNLEMSLGMSRAQADSTGLRGRDVNAGSQLKAAGNDYWLLGNTDATNASGFTALPGGIRANWDGISRYIGGISRFWSAAADGFNAFSRELGSFYSEINRSMTHKRTGQAIRLIRETNPSDAVIIGPAGGTVETEELIMHIPAGAFNQSAALFVSEKEDENPFEGQAATGVFFIEGLPDTINKPVRISLKIRDDSNMDEPGIAFGLSGENPVTGDTLTVYSVHAAEDSAGYLTGWLGEETASAKRIKKALSENFNNRKRDKILAVLGIRKKEVRSARFDVTFSGLFTPSFAEDFAARMENLLTVITDELQMTFENELKHVPFPSFSPSVFQNWDFPIRIVLRDADQPVSLLYNYLYPEHPYSPILNISDKLLTESNFNQARSKLGKALMKICLLTHLPNQFAWLNTAASAWSEEYFAEPGLFNHPSGFEGNEMAPFKGLEPRGFEGDFTGRCIGLSAVIKYLADRPIFGKEGVRKTYNSINEGQHYNHALLRNIDELPAEWWPDFFSSYISGFVYNVPGTVFTDPKNLSGTWTIASRDDAQKTFSSSDPDIGAWNDMSAKLFLVNIDDPDIQENESLVIDMECAITRQAVSVLVFAVNNGKLIYLGSAHLPQGGLRLNNLKERVDSGIHQFLAAVVNSDRNNTFTGSKDMDVLMYIDYDQPGPDLNRCGIDVTVNADRTHFHPDGSSDSYGKVTYTNSISCKGSFSGNTFTGSYSHSAEAGMNKEMITGTIKAVLNEDRSKIVHITWKQTTQTMWFSPGITSISTIQFEGTDIPLDHTAGVNIYRITGEETDNHITVLSAVSSTSQGAGTRLNSFDCGWDSRIYVSFIKE